MQRLYLFSLVLLVALTPLLSSCSQSYDIVITGGMVYDGTGGSPYPADIGIRNGSIVTIGSVDAGESTTIVNARGMYIAPGFIDMHTHCDRNLENNELKSAQNYLMQGVTTVVTGNCGSGTYNVEEYFTTLESQGVGINVIHLVGHGTVRREVLKQADREPTEEELQKMRDLVSQGMEAGAYGLSSGLFYAPGSYSKTDEVVELAKVAGIYKGIYASHIRDESDYTVGLKSAITEAISIGEQAGVPVQISHIKALGRSVWGMAPEISEIIENAQGRGVRVYADQYPYVASSTGLSAAVIPRWVQAEGGMQDRLRDPELASRIRKEIAENINRRGGPETIVISRFDENPDLEGKNLSEISKTRNKSDVETAIELVLEGGPGIVSFNMQDSDVEYFMKKPYVMTASDGSVPIFGKGVPHPRSYGTFTRKIREYVFNKKVVTMEHAIRSSSALPAEVLGLQNRGMLKEGYAADIVVFDPNTIEDKATFSEPHQYSEGIQTLIVNGVIVIVDGRYNGELAGKPLRLGKN